MEFIKLDEDRFLIKGSNGKIVSKREIIIQDIESNKCVKDLYKGTLKDEFKSKSVKKAKQINKSDSKKK